MLFTELDRLHKDIYNRSQRNCSYAFTNLFHMFPQSSEGKELCWVAGLDGRLGTKKKKFGYLQELVRSFWVLCLKVLNSSFLLLREAESGLKIM